MEKSVKVYASQLLALGVTPLIADSAVASAASVEAEIDTELTKLKTDRMRGTALVAMIKRVVAMGYTQLKPAAYEPKCYGKLGSTENLVFLRGAFLKARMGHGDQGRPARSPRLRICSRVVLSQAPGAR
jgi:hypothetical protein